MRKITQFQYSPEHDELMALTDDGLLWCMRRSGWERQPPIPQTRSVVKPKNMLILQQFLEGRISIALAESEVLAECGSVTGEQIQEARAYPEQCLHFCGEHLPLELFTITEEDYDPK